MLASVGLGSGLDDGGPPEVVCPDEPTDFETDPFIGGAVLGDALDTCVSDDQLLPVVRVSVWIWSRRAE